MDTKIKPEVWMPFYGQDFDRDTKGWARCDKWSYWAALWAYWCGECQGLTNDDEMLKRVCECLCIARADAWTACKAMIFGPKFKLSKDGLWHQGRAKELYTEAMQTIKVASDKGKSGARARWSKQCPSNAQAMPGHIPKQSLNECPGNGSSPSPSPSDKTNTEEVFEKFWEAYPKHDGRKPALKAFGKVKAPIETLLAAIDVQKKRDQWTKDGGKFIPMAATWLNGERWTDSQNPVAVKASGDWWKNIKMGATLD